jgi:small-conductance mechanosensitive channel
MTEIIKEDFKEEELSITKSKQYYTDNQNSKKQRVIFLKINEEIQKANLILKRGIDYKYFTAELAAVSELKSTSFDDVINNNNGIQSIRNLTLSQIMLNELLIRTEGQMQKIKKNSDELTNSQTIIDSLIISEVLFLAPSDSVSKRLYLQRFNQINNDVELLNNRFKFALDSINEIEIKANDFKYQLNEHIITIDKLREKINDFKSTHETKLFDKHENPKSFNETIILSLIKSFTLLVFYIANHSTLFICTLFLLLGLYTYIKILRKKYHKSDFINDFKYDITIFKSPFLTSVIISLTVMQFLLPTPPFIFVSLVWSILLLSLIRIFKKENDVLKLKVWRILGVIILFSFFLNNILYPSVLEIYLLLICALSSIIVIVYLSFKHQDEFIKPTGHILKIIVIIQLVGVIYLFMGNYNIGKVLITIGVFTIFLSQLLFFALIKILDVLRYSDYLKKPENDKMHEINFEKYEFYRFTTPQYILLITAWFILIFRTSHWFQNLINPFMENITEEKNIGSLSFSYINIILFFMVIIISSLISKVVSFLSSDTSGTIGGKNKIGSWLLLIRIGIMTFGVLLAFIISGFPIDRITIILSALGVGIGLGLQSITNNLVSGLIIAFEKPVNIGDTIEVGGQIGSMKYMGVRSSVITTPDGADVIIPNGELLNQNLTNWTLNSTRRRYEIKLGVSYGTDLQKIKDLLHEILNSNDKVLKIPEPTIWVVNFNDSSIDFSIKFWVGDLMFGNEVLSNILIAIDTEFKKHNIEIPFPQRDIHIISKKDE